MRELSVNETKSIIKELYVDPDKLTVFCNCGKIWYCGFLNENKDHDHICITIDGEIAKLIDVGTKTTPQTSIVGMCSCGIPLIVWNTMEIEETVHVNANLGSL